MPCDATPTSSKPWQYLGPRMEKDWEHQKALFFRTGVRPSSYKIHPDWVSEEVEVPVKPGDGTRGRRYHPWPYEFHGARSWPQRPDTSMAAPSPLLQRSHSRNHDLQQRPHSAVPDLQHDLWQQDEEKEGGLTWGTGLCETTWSSPLKHLESYAYPAPVRDRDVQHKATPHDVTNSVTSSTSVRIPARPAVLEGDAGRGYQVYNAAVPRPATHAAYKVCDNGVTLWVLDRGPSKISINSTPYSSRINTDGVQNGMPYSSIRQTTRYGTSNQATVNPNPNAYPRNTLDPGSHLNDLGLAPRDPYSHQLCDTSHYSYRLQQEAPVTKRPRSSFCNLVNAQWI